MGTAIHKSLKAVISNFNSITEPLVNTFRLMPIKSLLDKDKPDCLIVWNDILTDWRMMCEIANQNHIMTFMVQHGRGGMRDYLDGLHGHVANVAFVWSEDDKKTAIKGGWDKDSIFVVGAPWFYYLKERKPEKGLVVFDAVHWDKEVEENYVAWDLLNHIPNIHPVAKLIESHNRNKFPGEIVQTDRGLFGHAQKTIELLSRAECVVCMMEGTMELIAYALGVPVIFLKGFKHTKINFPTYQGKEDCVASSACITSSMNTLPTKIFEAINHPPLEEMKKELNKWAGNPLIDRPIAKITEIIQLLVNKYKAKNLSDVIEIKDSGLEK